jgi:hypothetical protein
MRHLLSSAIGRLADCSIASAITIGTLGIFSGGTAYLTNSLLMRAGASGVKYAVIDAAVIGGVAALIGSLVLIGVRERRQRDIEHLRAVAELNHHVRNALQVIVDDYYLSRDHHTEAVLESVDRIDRTLRSLFPADTSAAPEAMGEPRQIPSRARAEAA